MAKMLRALGALAAALLIGAGPPPNERVVTGDGVVDGQVNGVPARIRLDPGAGFPIISEDLAKRAGLHTGSPLLGKHWGFDFGLRIGPTSILSPTANGKLALGSAPFTRRIAWNARRYQADVDGVVGPSAIIESVVRFQLRAPLPSERTATLPLVEYSLLGFHTPSWALIKVGVTPLRVVFAPRIARSYLSAQSAARVAAELGGRADGAAEPVTIAFGIARPVRPMMLARPLVVGPLSLTRVGVRVAEGGGALPEKDDAQEAVDPNEVVVTAKAKHKSRPGTLTLGADVLSRCSSIVFDKPAKQIRLTCA